MAYTASTAKQAHDSHTDLVHRLQSKFKCSDSGVQHTSNMPGMRQSHTVLTMVLSAALQPRSFAAAAKTWGIAGNARLPPVVLHCPFEALQSTGAMSQPLLCQNFKGLAEC